MKLTNQDKDFLASIGVPNSDFQQIEDAMDIKYTSYKIYNPYHIKYDKISRSQAIKILGREIYLSGLSRSAFHFTSHRKGKNGREVYFNTKF